MVQDGEGIGRISVLITLLNDHRVVRAIESLLSQEHEPFEVVVADGGSNDGSEAEADRYADRGVRVIQIPGTVAQSRNGALKALRGDIVAFLDADEVAPPQWLRTLTEPILLAQADFTGGPTRPLGAPKSRPEAYLNAFEEWFYAQVVSQDVTQLPMGNSAWRVDLLRAIGGFDGRLGLGGEDFDVNLRAVRGGNRGLYVPRAWVFHDQSHLSTRWKVIRRKYRYSVGATMAYLKNGVFRRRALQAVATTASFHHPLEQVNFLLKPLAMVHGSLAWGLRRR